MKSILDPKFRYISSVKTDIRKTFKRVMANAKKTPLTPIISINRKVK